MSSVKKQIISGITYTAISKYSGIVISLIVTAILSRIISPSDFGVVAIATVIIAFFAIVSDLGIGPAIIQQRDLSRDELSNIFSFTVWTGILISLCFFFFSWVLSAYYKNSELLPISQLLSINLLFSTWTIVPNALLYKNKQFKFIASRNLIVQSIVGFISIMAALEGAGLYALVINPIFTSIIMFMLSYFKYPQALKRTWGIPSIRKIFTFSIYQFLFNVINYFSRNLDKLLIGKYVGLDALGYYEKSYRLLMLPLQNITHVITPVLHPIFSDYQNDIGHLTFSYLKIVRFLAFLGIPLSVFFSFSSNELVILIFGHQWERSVTILEILSFSIGIQIILSTSGSVFQAANDTKNLFKSGLFSVIMNLFAIFSGIFIFKTLEAVAWGIVLSFFINFIQCYVFMFKLTLKKSMKPFWKQLVRPLILGAILFIVFLFTSPLLKDINLLCSLFVKGIIFLLTFVAYIQLTKEYNIFEKLKYIYTKRGLKNLETK